MACENAINATDVLVEHMRERGAGRTSGRRWRPGRSSPTPRSTGSCPPRPPDAGLDVTVETYFEWAIERPPFGGNEPSIPDATWVDDLAPYIERKLFTVNTGHAATAYHGFVRGISKLSDALADDEVRAAVEGVLAETKQLLVDKHEFSPEAQQAYVDKILHRFANPYLPDTVDRVGRQPLRKLSRTERLIGPAAELAERGRPAAVPAGHRGGGAVVRRSRGPGERRAAAAAGDPVRGGGDRRGSPGCSRATRCTTTCSRSVHGGARSRSR